MTKRVAVVLFDLDGTLVDSAPDLVGACNEMRLARGLPPLPYARLRAMVGSGARGMIGIGFGVTPADEGYAALRDEFLDRYQSRMTRETRVFPAAASLIERLQARAQAWGIVTNKAARFAEPLVAWLGLSAGAATLVCGDTTAHAKPHPAPLLEAARRVGADPAACAYVGDDRRDVEAGRAAGMATLVAAWGYLGTGEPVEAWGADVICAAPLEVIAWLDQA